MPADFFYLQDSRSNVGSRAMFWRDGGGYGGCGRFLRPADYYTSCPHCGMGNAP